MMNWKARRASSKNGSCPFSYLNLSHCKYNRDFYFYLLKLTEWLILVISGIELITSLKNIPMQSTIPENITAATAIVKIVIIIFKSFLIFVTVIP